MNLVPRLCRKARAAGTIRGLLLATNAIILIAPPRPALAQLPAAPAADPQPSPKFTPEQVVTAQMQALSGPGAIAARIDRCYRFASPANRIHTGPVERFAGIIQAPRYAVLLDAKHFLVGRATQNGREAHVLVTVIDPNGNLSLFRCFLSKQTAPPYTDCWMTDAVVRIGDVGPVPPSQPPPPSTI